MTSDITKLTDREIDFEVCRALGIKVVEAACSADSYCAYDEIACFAYEIPRYSTAWSEAGPLLEMMPAVILTHVTNCTPEYFEIIMESGGDNGWIRHTFNASPTRVICEAFLKWGKQDPKGFKRAVEGNA